jgi:hypothetical protein
MKIKNEGFSKFKKENLYFSTFIFNFHYFILWIVCLFVPHYLTVRLAIRHNDLNTILVMWHGVALKNYLIILEVLS